MVDTNKSIADAIADMTDDDLDEGTEEGTEKEGSLLDDEETDETDDDDDTEEKEEEEEEPKPRGDVIGEEEEEEGAVDEKKTTESDDDEADPFDNMTPEDVAAIKANPALNKLRKALMRSYNGKTSEHSELVKLGNAYRTDPVGVLRAMAQQAGLTLGEPAAAGAKVEEKKPEIDPGQELEELFGDQVGPKVRAVFEKWAEARFGAKISKEIAPLKDSVTRTQLAEGQARMMSEEQSWKKRYNVTPDIEKQVVALGNSGKIPPGKGMTPGEYLDTLTDIVLARRSRSTATTTQTKASEKLANKIATNRRDREPTGTSGRGTVKKVSTVVEAKNVSDAIDRAWAELQDER